jgi:hypothetical protein
LSNVLDQTTQQQILALGRLGCLRDHASALMAFAGEQHFTLGKGPGIVVVSASNRDYRG